MRPCRLQIPRALWIVVAAAGFALPAHAQVRYLKGHTEPVYTVVYSPDGGSLISGSFDKTVRVWDRASGRTRRTIARHDNLVLAVAVSPDGRHVASGGLDKLVFVDEMPPAGPLAKFSALTLQPKRLAISHSGKLLATSDAEGRIVLVDVETREPLREISAGAEVVAMRFTSDDKQLLALTSDRGLSGWSVEDGAVVGRLSGLAAAGTAVTPSGTSVLVGGEDGILREYRWPPGVPTTVAVASPVRAIVAAPDSSWVAAAAEDGKVRFYNPDDGAELRSFEHGGDGHATMAVRADGAQLAVAGTAGTLRFWNPADGAPTGELAGLGVSIGALAYHPEGTQLALAAEDGTVRLCRLPLEADQETVVAETPLSHLQLSPDGQMIATVDGDHVLRLLKAEDRSVLRSVPFTAGTIRSLTFTPDSSRIVVSGDDMRIFIVAVATGGVLSIENQNAAVHSTAIGQEGKRLATGGGDGSIRIWDLADGALSREWKAHESSVVGVAYSADGTALISAGDGEVRIWNSADGSESRSFDVELEVSGFAISADGTFVAVYNAQGAIRVYKADDGAAVARIEPHSAAINRLRFTAGGQHLVVAYADAAIRVFQVSSAGEILVRSVPTAPKDIAPLHDGRSLLAACDDGLLRTLSMPLDALLAGHEGPVHAVAYITEGTRVATAGGDGSVRLWILETGSEERKLEGFDSPVLGLAVSPDGARLAACGENGRVRIWNLQDGAEVAMFESDTAVRALAWRSADRLAIGGDSNRIQIYDVAKGVIAESHEDHESAVLSLAIGSDGVSLFSGGADGTLRIWSSPLLRTAVGHSGRILAQSKTGDGSQIVTLGEDRTAAIWNLADLTDVNRFELREPAPTKVAINRTGSLIAVAGDDDKIHVWNVAEAKQTASFDSPRPVASLVLAEDGSLVHVVDTNGEVRTHRAADGALLEELSDAIVADVAPVLASDSRSLFASGTDAAAWRLSVPAAQAKFRLEGHESHIYGVAFDSGGERLASAGANKLIKLWNLADGANYANCTGHESQVYGVAFHPTEDQLVSCGADKTIRLWNAADGAELRKLTEGIAEGLYSVTHAPDGGRLLAAGLAKNWQVWNASEDSPALTVTGHSDHVYRALYNPAGTRIATLGYSGSLFIWEAETGAKLHEEQLPVRAAYSLAYSHDGAELAVGSVDSRVLLIDVPEAAR